MVCHSIYGDSIMFETKLTEAQREQIEVLYSLRFAPGCFNYSQPALGKMFGVSASTINHVLKCKPRPYLRSDETQHEHAQWIAAECAELFGLNMARY